MSPWHAWLLALATILTALFSSLLSHQVFFFRIIFVNVYTVLFFKYIYRNEIYAERIMVAYTGLIYRKVSEEEMSEDVRRRVFFKVLRISSHSMNSITSGEITNLLSNDASRVEIVLVFFNYLWVSRFFRKNLIG